MVVEHPIEDEVTQLARRVEKARGRLAYQFDPALTEALSEDELYAERELAERIRTQERAQRWKEAQAAAMASDRARHTTEAIEKADMRDLLLARKAIAAQRRESSPHAKLASLYRHRSWSLRALAGVVAAGMLWSAVNVQHNIAPGGPSDPLYWFSYLLEGMISVCLIIIMIGTNKVAEWGVADNRRQVAAAEIALLTLTIGLNTYPYLRAGAWYDAAVHAIAPVMIGVALLIHDAASARYGLAIARATEQLRELPDPAEQIRRTLPRYHVATAAQAAPPSEVGAPAQLEPRADRSVYPDPLAVDEPPLAPEPTVPVDVEQTDTQPTPVEAPRKPVLPMTIEDLDAMAGGEQPPSASVPRTHRDTSSTGLATINGASADAPADQDRVAATTESNPLPVTSEPAQPSAGTEAATSSESARPQKDTVKPSTSVSESSPSVSRSTTPVTKTETLPARPEDARTAHRPPRDAGSATTRAKSENGHGNATPDVVGSPPAQAPDIYDTGSFRVADILEQELAELQAERRRARTGRQRSTSAASHES
ncbi:hypothetical protein [Nocardia sp. CNY236]|uniref:hypothetical protein n=1 Tax=Nocardia sp. CNY236 TaxID=1169152 RepID=UPI0003F8F6E1|nr:hypothetical protein [Nocardia sp. CNY236]